MDSITTLNIGGLYTDPTEYNGKNICCEYCDKDAEYDSDYCEEHQPCYYCGETLYCVDNGKYCKEDIREITCCGVDITDYDIKTCPKCKENQ